MSPRAPSVTGPAALKTGEDWRPMKATSYVGKLSENRDLPVRRAAQRSSAFEPSWTFNRYSLNRYLSEQKRALAYQLPLERETRDDSQLL